MIWLPGFLPTNHAHIIAIDGRSGAGKTTLARALTQISGAQLVQLDDLYPGWTGLEAGVSSLLRNILLPFSRGRSGLLPTWDWQQQRPGPVRTVPFHPTLIVEGCGAGARRCEPYLAELIWLSAPTQVRRKRALARDGQAYAPHWQTWANAEQEHFTREQTATRARLSISTARADS